MLARWDPFREMITLRDAVDQLLRDSFVRPGSWLPADASPTVAFDVHDSDGGYVLQAELPGVRPEDTEILVQGSTVTIQGERKADEERQEGGYLPREHRYGSFRRSITLPAPISTDQAVAHFENGVLTLTLPKAEEARPKPIKVGAGQSFAGEPTPASAPAEPAASVN